MKRILIASTSTIYGGSYLEYLLPALRDHFGSVTSLLFIPYARPGGISHDAYTENVRQALKNLPFSVCGIHEGEDARSAIESAEAIFVGGGNTFVLLDQLYRHQLLEPLRQAVNRGVPYLGTSAGSNIVGCSIGTTNDMPIVHPESLEALGLVPFNLNPHYLDPDPASKHKGETRETRLAEFHAYHTTPVIGLREGSWISVKGAALILKGPLSARLFRQSYDPIEIVPESDLSKFC